MADKYIVIKKSESTAALEATGVVEEMVLIKTGTAAQTATAMSILSGIDDKKWISSDDAISKRGDISEGILLPKKVVEG